MKKKKLTSLDILDGTVSKSSALSRTEMKKIMAGSDAADCGICASWAVCCICLDGSYHGCQTSSMCSIYCGF